MVVLTLTMIIVGCAAHAACSDGGVRSALAHLRGVCGCGGRCCALALALVMKTIALPVGNVFVQLIAEGDAIARMTLNGKEWEPQTRDAWGALVWRGNGLVLDIGAYSGVYAIATALMGAKAMALEPHPVNYGRLLRNAQLNSMRFPVLNVAASSNNDTKTLRTKKPVESMSDTATLQPQPEMHTIQMHSIEVPAKRIDDLPITTRVGLIKIDVEHHELDVLLGARQVIEKHKPLLLVETLNPQAYDAVSMQLLVWGYRLVIMLDGRNAVYEVGV